MLCRNLRCFNENSTFAERIPVRLVPSEGLPLLSSRSSSSRPDSEYRLSEVGVTLPQLRLSSPSQRDRCRFRSLSADEESCMNSDKIFELLWDALRQRISRDIFTLLVLMLSLSTSTSIVVELSICSWVGSSDISDLQGVEVLVVDNVVSVRLLDVNETLLLTDVTGSGSFLSGVLPAPVGPDVSVALGGEVTGGIGRNPWTPLASANVVGERLLREATGVDGAGTTWGPLGGILGSILTSTILFWAVFSCNVGC
uniref:(northern house mosquito) hypothetical protein n=1 Tax=Culex pipiens TaxID=7175 RepID=A0A8D8G0R7_CULPI